MSSETTLSEQCMALGCKAKGLYVPCCACNRVLCTRHDGLPVHSCLYLDVSRLPPTSVADFMLISQSEQQELVNVRHSYHYVPADNEILRIISQVATSNVVNDALALRPTATTCHIEIPPATIKAGSEVNLTTNWALNGQSNINFPLTFDDGGDKWIVRVRRAWRGGAFNARLRMLLLSEFATMRALREVAPEFILNAWLPMEAESNTTRGQSHTTLHNNLTRRHSPLLFCRVCQRSH